MNPYFVQFSSDEYWWLRAGHSLEKVNEVESFRWFLLFWSEWDINSFINSPSKTLVSLQDFWLHAHKFANCDSERTALSIGQSARSVRRVTSFRWCSLCFQENFIIFATFILISIYPGLTTKCTLGDSSKLAGEQNNFLAWNLSNFLSSTALFD